MRPCLGVVFGDVEDGCVIASVRIFFNDGSLCMDDLLRLRVSLTRGVLALVDRLRRIEAISLLADMVVQADMVVLSKGGVCFSSSQGHNFHQ